MAHQGSNVFRSLLRPLYTGPGHPTATVAYPETKENRHLIRDSIIAIVLTKLGQRLFVPDFGSRLHDAIFEPNDRATFRLIETSIVQAIRTWEPRVRILKIDVEIDEHTMDILLDVLVIKLNETFKLPISIDRSHFFNAERLL